MWDRHMGWAELNRPPHECVRAIPALFLFRTVNSTGKPKLPGPLGRVPRRACDTSPGAARLCGSTSSNGGTSVVRPASS